jgi:hypothetical protein
MLDSYYYFERGVGKVMMRMLGRVGMNELTGVGDVLSLNRIGCTVVIERIVGENN